MKQKIGFIGQGWIGKNYADNFEQRGFEVVRYALEEPYVQNKEKIKDCDMVFIAVPTPSTPKGFDDSIVRGAVKLVGPGKIVIIKSTIVLGTTVSIQKENPDIFVLHSPEFLREESATHDAANPDRNIIGLPVMNETYQNKAKEVLQVLPKANFNKIMKAEEAEMVKYFGNCWLYVKVIFTNIFYDLVAENGLNWDNIKDAVSADPRIGKSHMDPVHKNGRGAGGHCFIKDFYAFSRMYEKYVQDDIGTEVLRSMEKKNNELLIKSNKDLDLLRGVYGEEVTEDNE